MCNQYSETCLRCNRPLASEASRQRGMGAVCARKSGCGGTPPKTRKSKRNDSVNTDKETDTTYTGFVKNDGITLLKAPNGHRTITLDGQRIVYHSPTGMAWGYGGSGAADLALNILFAYTENEEWSKKHHQQFKWDFVAGIPEVGGHIPAVDIMDWIVEHNQSAEDEV